MARKKTAEPQVSCQIKESTNEKIVQAQKNYKLNTGVEISKIEAMDILIRFGVSYWKPGKRKGARK